MENKFKFQLGDLVVLNSFSQKQAKSLEENSSDKSNSDGKVILEKPNTTENEKKYFDLNNCDMPIMVVHEIAHNPNMEKLYEEQTGKQIASKTKYLCF